MQPQLIEAKAKPVRKTFTKNRLIILQFALLALSLYAGIRMFRSNYLLVSPVVKKDGYISQVDANNYRALYYTATTSPNNIQALKTWDDPVPNNN